LFLKIVRWEVPGQQLLDRVLIGYPRDGEFHRCEGEVHVYLAPQAADAELRRRLADFPLHRESTIEQAVTGADGIVVVPGHVHSAALAKSCLAAAPGGSAVFVYGAIAGDLSDAQNLVSLAESRKVPFAAGTSLAVTWRLPDVDVPAGAPVKRALIVVQGESPLAELHALDGLLPLLERRKNGERGVRSVRSFTGDATWAAGERVGPPASSGRGPLSIGQPAGRSGSRRQNAGFARARISTGVGAQPTGVGDRSHR